MDNTTKYEAIGSSILVGHCKTFYARKKGRSHVENGTVCQDYCLVEEIGDEIQVVCVADGHGGEAYTKSDKGSFYACNVFVELIKTIKRNSSKEDKGNKWIEVLKTRDFKKIYIESWKKAVIDDYHKENSEATESIPNIIKKYGTTFLFVIYVDGTYVVGQLGDGAILLSNDFGQSQLFKRHGVKVSSATSSLASNRAKYAFVIDSFDNDCFNSVLLSTDGIYDKLDNDSSFSLYERSLIEQIENEGELKKPFDVQGIDVSEITKDDCTIALIKSEKKGIPISKYDLEKEGLVGITFSRHMRGIDVFEAMLDNEKVEVHLIDGKYDEFPMDIRSATLILPQKIIPVKKNKVALVYKISDDYHRIARLVESGEHLEKKYWFNEYENDDDETVNSGDFSNEYWLDFYENLLCLEDELRVIRIAVASYLNECLFVTKDNKLFILSDALRKEKDIVAEQAIERLLDRFSIIGSLSCGKIKIPLFETISQGQSIAMLHVASERKVLCKVIYNNDKKILGLWNATTSSWNLENEKRKEIPVQGVIRLNKDHIFYVLPDESEKNNDAEFVDGYAKYQVKILRR